MDFSLPPPGGGTPIRGNRIPIIMNENDKLKNEIILLRKMYENVSNELHLIRQENKELKREISNINSNLLENANENQCFERNEEPVEMEANEEQIIYETDEEELERETNWILKKARKSKKVTFQKPTTTEKNIKKRGDQRKENANNEHMFHIPPPPINIINIHEFETIQNILKDIPKENYKIVALNNNMFKVNLTDESTYRNLVNTLNVGNYQWFTYENKNERPIRVMIRGLHCSTKTVDIIDDLKFQNLDVIDVVNIIKKTNSEGNRVKTPLPLFMASFSNKESVDSIYNVRYVLNTKVKVESLKKNNIIIPQCKRCQGFNHTQKYCSREPRCVSCSGKHLSAQCTVEKTTAPSCVNCMGRHPANYRGCEVAKELQKIRKKTIRSKQNDRNNNQGDLVENIEMHSYPQQATNHSHQSSGSLTYAQACKSKSSKNNEDVSYNTNQEILKAITQLNRRLEEQSYINEKIFDKLRTIEARL